MHRGYACKLCSAVFKTASSRRSHVARSHKEENARISEKLPVGNSSTSCSHSNPGPSGVLSLPGPSGLQSHPKADRVKDAMNSNEVVEIPPTTNTLKSGEKDSSMVTEGMNTGKEKGEGNNSGGGQ